MISYCKVTVEQHAIWRWFIYAQESKRRDNALSLALRKLKPVLKVFQKQLALYRWGELVRSYRVTQLSRVTDRESLSQYSESPAKNRSAYVTFLHRHMKLNVVRTLVNYCRINTEQIALWRWKFKSDEVTRSLQRRTLKRCDQLVLKSKALRLFSRWSSRTRLAQSFSFAHSRSHSMNQMSFELPEFNLREVLTKARIRWHYSLKAKFAVLRGKRTALSLITPRTLLHQLKDRSRVGLSRLVKKMQFISKQRSSMEFKGLLKWQASL
jgi:hypothetical protein